MKNYISDKNAVGWNVLMDACFHGQEDTVKLLLQKAGQFINLKDKDNGLTAFDWACEGLILLMCSVPASHPKQKNWACECKSSGDETDMHITLTPFSLHGTHSDLATSS